ncbi:Zinc finger BED domain-containing protein RICESLEEPER [Quillaja saponaria]|uniref:Zinc finger BED domain-containing protein RICESLEEPER n=1 Tax=Quillaja saponaria TaxID=32244 RepID=A0AAD7LBY6_QUISA|nr:Zinc finger BED domain-containing protein RICESLEEPER [Quillaja saponaria]
MIILHEYPLSIVDHIGFKRCSTALQPSFKVVSRNTIKEDIMKIYESKKEVTMKFMEDNEGRVAITTDMWTTSNQKKGFMAITAHYIDASWTLQSRILKFFHVLCPHTKEKLCQVLFDCLLHWNITKKISTVTLDNCSTNNAMIDVLLEKLDSSSLILSGSLIHMRCAAHVLNLVVNAGLQLVKRSVDKIRESVMFWRATPKREEKFEEAARHLLISYSKKLVLDVATRWNSIYLMLEIAIVYKSIFARLLRKETSKYKIAITEEDWEFARELCGRLKIFYEVTEELSDRKYPTINLFFPSICNVRLALGQWFSSSNSQIKLMASSMIAKFDKYWDVISGVVGVATVLDPRYKMKLIEFYFPKIYVDRFAVESERILQLVYDLVFEYQSRGNSCSRGVESSGNLSQDMSEGGSQDPLAAYDLFIKNDKRAKNLKVKYELDHYLDEDVLPRSKDFDILMWWKVNGIKYPILQAIARDFLGYTSIYSCI